ncbi:MAG: iron-containing alcohol dehydrogenase family protein [Firmicutes bacterium]|nr:iron-containing alcohol dehydrogenase family protein [Bacillota bacterium]
MRRNRPYLFLQAAPGQYINKKRIIEKSGNYIQEWGKRALISGGIKALKSLDNRLINSLEEYNICWKKHIFTGECCDNNILTIREKAINFSADLIIGVGGGKSLDTAKAAAEECNIPIITIPTIAATCAATTAVSIIYNEAGEYIDDFYLKTNPKLVLVDPQIIADAPLKYLQSGIFDALSKWYEGKAAVKGIERPDIYTLAAMELAALLNREMEANAGLALDLTKCNLVGKELIDIIDLNIYLTGMIQSLGMSTCRGAAAHAIHNGLTLIPESHKLLHGIKVGYGIIVQLYIEDLPQSEIDTTINFFKELGLETSFKSLNLPYENDLVDKVSLKAANDPSMKKMPMHVSMDMVEEAIKKLEKHMAKF